ncbi:MAG: tetratricopeptide repeat protein, partial [Rudaea sp.]
GTPARRPSSLAGADIDKCTTLPNPSVLPRILRGDLDTIILKCLATEPEQRYASAGALASDIERYLAGRPVEAHPPSRWYRARKFVRRHRGSVAITAALVIAVLAGLTAALWQANVARYEAARANRVRGFMEDMFTPIHNSVIEAKQTSVQELLANATDKLNKNTGLTAAERIDLQMLFSRLHEKMGESKQAQALAQQAAQLSESKLATDDPESLEAQVLYAYSLLEHDAPEHAEPLLVALEARTQGSSALPGGARIMLNDGLAELADMHGHHDVARDYEQRALQERIAQAGADSASAATGYNNLAISLDLSGHHAEAINAFRNSWAILIKQDGPDSLETANARNNLAMAELQLGRLQAARKDFLAGEKLYDAAPNNKRNRNARYWQDRCLLATAIGTDIRTTCDRAVQVTREILGAGEVAWTARALRLGATSKLELGDLAGARADVQRANDLLASAQDPVALGINDYLLAEVDVAQGDAANATASFARSIKRLANGGPEYLRLRALAGLALACTGSTADACRGDPAETARTALDEYSDRWNPWVLPANTAIARIDLDAGHADAAIARLRSAIEHVGGEVDATQVELLSAQEWLAVAEATVGECDLAGAQWHALHATLQAHGLEQHPLLVPAIAALRSVRACSRAFDF